MRRQISTALKKENAVPKVFELVQRSTPLIEPLRAPIGQTQAGESAKRKARGISKPDAVMLLSSNAADGLD
jgi:hypothetical protein